MSDVEQPSPVFTYDFVVTDDMIDRNDHVNNVVYVSWMQDLAVAHSKAVMPAHLLTELGLTWVARSHHIEYLSPAFSGDQIEARTWLTGYRRVRCHRRYEFIRSSDHKLVARGETDWVLVSAADGRPKSIPETIKNVFPELPD